MHAEEPATIPEPQPTETTETTETPAVDDSRPPAVATRPTEEDSPSPVAVPENENGNADSSAFEPSQVVAQLAMEEDLVASSTSVPPPGPATLVPPVEPPTAPAPQNPRRKRRAKGWSCPVCRQRECLILRSSLACFDLFGDSGSSYSLHVSVAYHHHSTFDGRRQGRKTHLDVDRRPPIDSCRSRDSRHSYRTDGHPRPRVNAGGATGTRACAFAFILPCTLASRS